MAANALAIKFDEFEYEPDERTFDDTPTNVVAFTGTTVTIPYEPRPIFLEFHNRAQQWAGLVCHRRAGKTVACVAELVHRAIYTGKTNARYAYVAPFFRQAKDVAWVYLKDMVRDIAVDIRESELRVILPNGAWITLYGADNPDALRGLYLDGAVLDEFGDCRPNLWAEVILPTLMDRNGWAVFIGTPKGKNEFWKIIERARAGADWFHLTLKASISKLLPGAALEMMREQMTEDQYAQEMECSFEAAVLGTYYAGLVDQAEQKGHVKSVPHDPEFPVHVAMDLGFTDSTSMWFWQQRPDGLAVIDFEEENSKPLSYYLDLLDSKPYNYGTIWLPHDAKAKTLQTGRSTVEQFLKFFEDDDINIQITPSLSVQHGIDAGRFVLPSCYFDLENCTLGIEALRAYRRKYDEINNCFSNKPMHDWSSHGADAFRYMAIVAKEYLPNQPTTPGDLPMKRTSLKAPEVKLAELWQQRDDDMNRRSGRPRIE